MENTEWRKLHVLEVHLECLHEWGQGLLIDKEPADPVNSNVVVGVQPHDGVRIVGIQGLHKCGEERFHSSGVRCGIFGDDRKRGKLLRNDAMPGRREDCGPQKR